MRRVLTTLTLIACVVLVSAGPSVADTWLVQKDGTGDFELIQDAIDAAASGDEVMVGSGTYTDLHVDSQGTLTIVELKSGVAVRALNGPDATILDASAEGERRCVSGYGVDAAAMLEGFTVTGGDAPIGGGIFLADCDARITRNRVVENDSGAGAGIVCDGATSPLIEENEVIDNYACCGEGGGILCTGGSNARLYRNEVRGNEGFGGGGIALSQSGAPEVFENLVVENTGLAGGGIATIASGGLIERNLVLDNNSQQGGGIASWSGGGATFSHNVVARNFAQGDGGGYHISADSPTLINETVVGNESYLGAGIFSWNNSSARIEKCIVAFGVLGEGIWVDDPSSVPEVICTDVFGNDFGGYGGFIDDQTGTRGNIAIDPRFCDLEQGDYHLGKNSPVRLTLNQVGTVCGVRGALEDVCDPEGDARFVPDEPSGKAHPNPTRGAVWISQADDNAENSAIRIIDVTGRRVRELEAAVGKDRIHWDGKDEQGRQVVSGVYFVIGSRNQVQSRILVNR